MQFKPNVKLLNHYDNTAQDGSRKPPYVAIYRLGKKTLVYMAECHVSESSWNMLEWCFSKKSGLRPDVLLTEFENAGRDLNRDDRTKKNTLSHAAFVAAEHDVPVVLSDLSESQMMDIIGTNDKKHLHDVLKAGSFSKGNDLQKDCAKLGILGRNPFMVQNIAAALNKYDTVFCIFGEGHFREQRAVLDDMFGKGPDEFITEFPNMHTNFGKSKRNLFQNACDKIKQKLHRMEIIRLVEFGKEGEL